MSRSQTSFEAFPPEIAHIIGAVAGSADLCNLRLVSRTVHSLITPITLRDISLLYPVGYRSTTSTPINARLSTCIPDTSTHTTHQCNNSEALSDPKLTNLYNHAQQLRVRLKPEIYLELDHSAFPAFYETLKRFRSLKSLILEGLLPNSQDEALNRGIAHFQEAICSSVLVATGGILERLFIQPRGIRYFSTPNDIQILDSVMSVEGLTFPQCLLNVTGLKELVFAYDTGGWACPRRDEWSPWLIQDPYHIVPGAQGEASCCLPSGFERNVQEIIKRNPSIEDLTVSYGCVASGFTSDRMFDNSGNTLTRLRCLGLTFPTVLGITPTFHKLTHLTIDTPSSDVNLDNLWLTLIKNDSQSLISIKTAQVSIAFVDFLSSFRGLKTLDINSLMEEIKAGITIEGETSPSAPLSTIARAFFVRALPNHAPSLEQFSITFASDVLMIPGWVYTPEHFVPNFARMTSLRHLVLEPGGISNIIEDKGDQLQRHAEVVFPEFQSILNGIDDACSTISSLNQGPGLCGRFGGVASLDLLEIKWTEATYHCGYGYTTWFDSVTELLSTHVVGRLRTRSGVPRVLRLISGDYKATMLHDGTWGYVEIGTK